MRSESDSPRSVARADNRKAMLIYLDPKLIQALKIEALEKQTHVYLIIEELLKKRGSTSD